MQGWFAYSIDNLIVVEDLKKERSQKIITLPDYVSCMALSRDFKYILAGSATRNEKDIASIHIVETITNTIRKSLSFHTRGVQSIQFTPNGKYLVTVGNFKECTGNFVTILACPSTGSHST